MRIGLENVTDYYCPLDTNRSNHNTVTCLDNYERRGDDYGRSRYGGDYREGQDYRRDGDYVRNCDVIISTVVIANVISQSRRDGDRQYSEERKEEPVSRPLLKLQPRTKPLDADKKTEDAP